MSDKPQVGDIVAYKAKRLRVLDKVLAIKCVRLRKDGSPDRRCNPVLVEPDDVRVTQPGWRRGDE